MPALKGSWMTARQISALRHPSEVTRNWVSGTKTVLAKPPKSVMTMMALR